MALSDLMLSADSSFQNVGSTWTQRALPSNVSWISAIWGNPTSGNIFVALSYNSNYNTIGASSPDGITWTQRTLPNAAWGSLAFGNDTFVALSSSLDTSVGATSSDGITWTQRGSPPGTGNAWFGAAFGVVAGSGTFVGISGGTLAATSTNNGASWSAGSTMPDPGGNRYRAVAYGNGMFVAIVNGSNLAASSPDGVTWTAQTLPASAGWLSLAFGNGVFIALEISGTSAHCATSPDGVNWTAQSMPGNNWITLTFGNGVFVAAANGQPWIATSTNGMVWIMRPLPVTSGWRCSAYGNETFVILDNDNAIAITSP